MVVAFQSLGPVAHHLWGPASENMDSWQFWQRRGCIAWCSFKIQRVWQSYIELAYWVSYWTPGILVGDFQPTMLKHFLNGQPVIQSEFIQLMRQFIQSKIRKAAQYSPLPLISTACKGLSRNDHEFNCVCVCVCQLCQPRILCMSFKHVRRGQYRYVQILNVIIDKSACSLVLKRNTGTVLLFLYILVGPMLGLIISDHARICTWQEPGACKHCFCYVCTTAGAALPRSRRFGFSRRVAPCLVLQPKLQMPGKPTHLRKPRSGGLMKHSRP